MARCGKVQAMKRTVHRLTVALGLVACNPTAPGSGATPQTPRVASQTPETDPPPGDPDPPRSAPDNDTWVVTIHGTHGDCAPDADSCDELYVVASDASWSSTFEAHPLATDRTAVTSRGVLPAEEFARFREIVTSKAFDDEMAAGFACQGGKDSHDYSWRFTFKTPAGERAQQAAHCISGPSQVLNTPGRLLRLIRRK
jgi:hypothetical protein